MNDNQIKPGEPVRKPTKKQCKAPKNRLFLHLWWMTLVVGLTYLFVFPQADASSPAIVKKTKNSKQTAGTTTQGLFTASIAKQNAFPLPTKLPKPTTAAQPTATETATTAPTDTPTPIVVTHVIEKGEMLLSIAMDYGTDVDAIMAANNIDDPTLLQIGQELIIPVTPTATPAEPTATATPKESPTPTPTPRTHVIAKGESPLYIANKYGVSTDVLMQVNGIFDPSSLQVGQELIIPSGDDMTDAALNHHTTLHAIKRGDTLLGLSVAYGSTVEDILAANPALDPTTLQIGQQLVIPLTQPRSTANIPQTYSKIEPVTIPALSSPGIIGLQQQMIAAINTYRQANGLSAYVVDEGLNQVAMARAQDMDTRGYFSHWNPEGKNAEALVHEQGFATGRVSENIERNIRPESETVEQSINWFMGDGPHRYNILHPNYTRIGVGVSNMHQFHTFVLIFANE
jgi:LysM repeat protein